MNTNNQLRKKELYGFFALTFVIFWILLGLTGFAISLGISPALQTVLKNVCAWSSTFAVLILFKKLYPQKTLLQHIKENFKSQIKWQVILFVILTQLTVYFLALISYSIVNKLSFSSIEFVALPSILPLLIINITSGPLGEELGWRGFVYNELRVKYSLIQTAVIIGFVWGFWHFPLWLLSGYQGVDLVAYISVFMVSIIEISILIALFYDENRNLFFPILIHFLFNFLLTLVKIDLIQLFIYTAIFNAVALFLILVAQKVMAIKAENHEFD
jgi:membrane protease YdiL (CAAX protease family)